MQDNEDEEILSIMGRIRPSVIIERIRPSVYHGKIQTKCLSWKKSKCLSWKEIDLSLSMKFSVKMFHKEQNKPKVLWRSKYEFNNYVAKNSVMKTEKCVQVKSVY